MQTGSNAFGLYVNSYERGTFKYTSINPLYQFTTTPPLPGAQDLRIFPWHDERPHDVVVSFKLEVRTVRRANPESHVYGHPMLRFINAAPTDIFILRFKLMAPWRLEISWRLTTALAGHTSLRCFAATRLTAHVFLAISSHALPRRFLEVVRCRLRPTSSSALTALISRA